MRNFKFQIITSAILLVVICQLSFVSHASADAVVDNGLNFLRSKQDTTGQITTGFSAPSQWSAIAFTAAGVDISTIKNPTNSLKDFLLTDIPASSAAATEFETRILAIVAIGDNPTNFGGTNFVQNLQATYDGTQIGDACSLNDDIFGLLALVASGNTSSAATKQGVLNFIISKQYSNGGFGFSAPGGSCPDYGDSADMTSAAIQVLQVAKTTGLANAGLDNAINNAKNYLLTNQNADGGFGYFGSSDTDSTGWVLMALNVLSMGTSTETTNARNYLISQQSAIDGGITAFDWGSSTFVSNATTTAQALIGLFGKSWILKIYTPPTSPTPTPTITNTPTPTPTATPSSNSSSSPTPTPTNTPTPTPTPTTTSTPISDIQVSPTPKKEVLGTTDSSNKDSEVAGANSARPFLIKLFLVLGFGSLAAYLIKRYYNKLNG